MSDNSSFPNITNFDLNFGFQGLDSSYAGGDPDNDPVDDDPLILQEALGQYQTVLATFESTEDISGLWADGYYDSEYTGLDHRPMGPLQIRPVEGTENQYEVYTSFVHIEQMMYLAPDGLVNATITLHSGFDTMSFDFHMINGEVLPGSAPVIGQNANDLEDPAADDPNVSVLEVASEDIANFTSTHTITDPDSSSFTLADAQDAAGAAPYVIDSQTGQAIDSSYYELTIENGTVTFQFTEAGISQMGLNAIAEQSQSFSAVFRVKDGEGNLSEAHTMNLTITGEEDGSGGNATPTYYALRDADDQVIEAEEGAQEFFFYYQQPVSAGSGAGLAGTPNADFVIHNFDIAQDSLSFAVRTQQNQPMELDLNDADVNEDGDLILYTPEGSAITLVGITLDQAADININFGSLNTDPLILPDETVELTDESDSYRGSSDADAVYGDDGDDVIKGRDGDDHLQGGNGDDMLLAGRGDDIAEGGNGDDFLLGGSGNDSLSGGEGDDNIRAGNGDDLVRGGDGDDLLRGESGNDVIHAGEGIDTLHGGSGDDELHAGIEGSTIYGDSGDDTIHNSHGDDLIYGGIGNDTFIASGGTSFSDYGEDVIYGGSGNDTFVDHNHSTTKTVIIKDFAIGSDKLSLNRSFDELEIVNTEEGAMVGDFLLEGIDADDLSDSDFI